MTPSPADRALEVLAQPQALALVRALADEPMTQAAAVAELKLGQSTVSRTLKDLRAAGFVVSDGRKGIVRLRCHDEMLRFLMAADRLAERLIHEDHRAQAEASERTRRAAIRPAHETAEPASDA